MKQIILAAPVVAGSVALAVIALLGSGCRSTRSGGGGAGTSSAQPAYTSRISEAGGAELWARNCGYCHRSRSPSTYGETQWDVAMLHMRVRANLTAVEYRKILAFLKSE